MRWLVPIVLVGLAVFVFVEQRSGVQKIEEEFAAKVIEIKNHKFEVPAVPEKDNNFEISAADIKKMRRQINSPDLLLSADAMSKLWKAQDETIIPSINRILETKYSSCYSNCDKIALRKLSAVDTISRDRSRINLKMLLTASKDKNKDVRLASIKALGDYLIEDVVDPLQNAMSDKETDVSLAAGEGLEKVVRGMKNWKQDQIDQLIHDYSRKISTGDYESAERKLKRIVRKIERASSKK